MSELVDFIRAFWPRPFAVDKETWMTQWQLEPKPKAQLTVVDPEPIDRGDGAKVQRWKTAQGVIHAQVIYPNPRIEWYLQVKA